MSPRYSVLAMVLLVFLLAFDSAVLRAEVDTENPHYLAPPTPGMSQQEWLKAALQFRQDARAACQQPDSRVMADIYQRQDLAWMSKNFTCAMCMVYDESFFDKSTNEYRLDSYLEDGKREFGGYDSIVLWHAYPRLGIDQRNQFDFYRELPGGLNGLHGLVEKCHAQDVRVFIDYNPWDTGTRRENEPDYDVLASIVTAIDADGVFLDTLSEGSQQLLETLQKAKPGAALVCEGHPPLEQLPICQGSWAQWLLTPDTPAILKLKWIEPRHMQYQVRRWDRCREDEIADAFFNGSGMLVWENVFGTYTPWSAADRQLWKRASQILRFFAERFTSPVSRPYYPAKLPALKINYWPGADYDLYVLSNPGREVVDEVLFSVPNTPATTFCDVWNGRILEPEESNGELAIRARIDRLGCILALNRGQITPMLSQLLQSAMGQEGGMDTSSDRNTRRIVKPVADADPISPTPLADKSNPLTGMVYVAGETKVFRIKHVRGECGCFSDPGVTNEEGDFGYGLQDGATYPEVIHEEIEHSIGPVRVESFFVDEAEVSNSQFKQFLDQTGYRPQVDVNFLKHWPEGQMPAALADHPVVYIDIDDARAYAQWAGKRLPTELEWQLAAQGPDSRKWPWGDEFDSEKCNTTGTTTMEVRSCPAGRSPCGCYHMAGNVWEWTESCRDDGHTSFTMLRGGSYFDAKGSIWYVKGGPQPCAHHAKFVRVWPGLDRCSTVGFRCVKDVAESR